ncbi:hypothetical protein [Thermoactinomyces sp. CICC 10523]|uniref:hypothetical protein n=1 Tax=Thermoactinomyces sp. CICC 10523 TaxID=2767428 RepID=UPI0018DDF917|nr:hypothetical protein [Thermoactinomyces sp. CICC 10523]MBH8599452.1 hypothetical protein [Thermoactinomyces sp. CICC 10523]
MSVFQVGEWYRGLYYVEHVVQFFGGEMAVARKDSTRYYLESVLLEGAAPPQVVEQYRSLNHPLLLPIEEVYDEERFLVLIRPYEPIRPLREVISEREVDEDQVVAWGKELLQLERELRAKPFKMYILLDPRNIGMTANDELKVLFCGTEKITYSRTLDWGTFFYCLLSGRLREKPLQRLPVGFPVSKPMAKLISKCLQNHSPESVLAQIEAYERRKEGKGFLSFLFRERKESSQENHPPVEEQPSVQENEKEPEVFAEQMNPSDAVAADSVPAEQAPAVTEETPQDAVSNRQEAAQNEELPTEDTDRRKLSQEEADRKELPEEDANRKEIPQEDAEREELPQEDAEREERLKRLEQETLERLRREFEERQEQLLSKQREELEKRQAELLEKQRQEFEKREQELLKRQKDEFKQMIEKEEQEEWEREQQEKERLEQERLAKQREEEERRRREELEKERKRLEKEQEERLQKELERMEKERLEWERKRQELEKKEEELEARLRREFEKMAQSLLEKQAEEFERRQQEMLQKQRELLENQTKERLKKQRQDLEQSSKYYLLDKTIIKKQAGLIDLEENWPNIPLPSEKAENTDPSEKARQQEITQERLRQERLKRENEDHERLARQFEEYMKQIYVQD